MLSGYVAEYGVSIITTSGVVFVIVVSPGLVPITTFFILFNDLSKVIFFILAWRLIFSSAVTRSFCFSSEVILFQCLILLSPNLAIIADSNALDVCSANDFNLFTTSGAAFISPNLNKFSDNNFSKFICSYPLLGFFNINMILCKKPIN